MGSERCEAARLYDLPPSRDAELPLMTGGEIDPSVDQVLAQRGLRVPVVRPPHRRDRLAFLRIELREELLDKGRLAAQLAVIGVHRVHRHLGGVGRTKQRDVRPAQVRRDGSDRGTSSGAVVGSQRPHHDAAGCVLRPSTVR